MVYFMESFYIGKRRNESSHPIKTGSTDSIFFFLQVPVASWFDDMTDSELLDLIPFFEKLSKMDNVYTVLCNSNHPYNNGVPRLKGLSEAASTTLQSLRKPLSSGGGSSCS